MPTHFSMSLTGHRSCVAGRVRSDEHVTRTNAEQQFPVVGIDYGYLREGPEVEVVDVEEDDNEPEWKF